MMINKNTEILIVGLGVIGGSYAESLTEQGYCVNALTLKPEDIEYALNKGIISYGTTEPTPELLGKCDLIISALYPTVFIEWVEKYQNLLKAGALITDVTGVKGTVVERVQNILRPDIEFIAAHPMAGREASGVEYSDQRVFHGANYIVTPTEKNTKEAIDTAHKLGEILGFARISTLSVDEHDKMIAFLSQLTHCIAVTLMTCNDEPNLEKYTGDSFRDLTRIAKINDKMWSELFIMNKDALLSQMDAFSREFGRLREMLINEDVDGMREMMKKSTARRALFDKPSKKEI